MESWVTDSKEGQSAPAKSQCRPQGPRDAPSWLCSVSHLAPPLWTSLSGVGQAFPGAGDTPLDFQRQTSQPSAGGEGLSTYAPVLHEAGGSWAWQTPRITWGDRRQSPEARVLDRGEEGC